MTQHSVVSREEWLRARLALLEQEKALTRARDQVAEARRQLPWVRLDQDYRFVAADGPVHLSELFDGRSQLIVYHFMYGPQWQAGCPSCSFWADGYEGVVPHLAARDIALAVVSRAPIEHLSAYRSRMGWRFNWVSSLASTFNTDFEVSFSEADMAAGEVRYNYRATTFPSEEAPGVSVFHRDTDGSLFHTYSCYSRGLDILNVAYHHMDLVPKGRDEAALEYPMAWVRRHDEY